MSQQQNQTITDHQLQIDVLLDIEMFKVQLANLDDWAIVEDLEAELEVLPGEDPVQLSRDIVPIFKKFHLTGEITPGDRKLLESTYILLLTNNAYINEA